MLEHGGRLRAAAREHGRPLADWLDLSTGISPWSWLEERPLALPIDCWSRLPEDEDGLGEAARAAYGADALPVAGSQAAIQALPLLRAPARVGLIAPSYAEHAQSWRRAGHELVPLSPEHAAAAASTLDVLLLVHPNNPAGQRYPRSALLDWHARLAARGGWLVLDEAFIDATPGDSLAALSAQPGLVVLRSLGKFFGLAGARVGFVLAEARLRAALAERLGPWTVSGPARVVATQALRDHHWQAQQRTRLQAAGERLRRLLAHAGLAPDGGCALFQWLRTTQAQAIHARLAEAGILTRLFEEPASLRFGLPRDEAQWQRLQQALQQLSRRAA